MTKRKAILVATAAYENDHLRPLRAPLHDAASLATVLADPQIGGYEITKVSDQPVHAIDRAVHAFLIKAGPEDELLVYFSCHGLKDYEDRLYFAGTDSVRDPDLLESHAFAASKLSRYLEESPARRKILLLDCCFSGAYKPGAKGAEAPVDVAGSFADSSGTVIITATDETQEAFELVDPQSSRPLSVFTDALIQGLSTGEADIDGDGQISANDLYTYLCKALKRAGSRQRPKQWLLDATGALKIALSRRRYPKADTSQTPVAEPRTPAPAPRASGRSGSLGEAAICDVLRYAPSSLGLVVHPDPGDSRLQRLRKEVEDQTGETVLGYRDQGHHLVEVMVGIPVWRRHNGFLVFTDRSIRLTKQRGIIGYPALARSTIEPDKHEWTVQQSYGPVDMWSFAVKVTTDDGQEFRIGTKSWDTAEALCGPLKELARLARS